MTTPLTAVRVRVLGIGNVLMGDDAVGPYAVSVLEARYRLPERVSADDVGTPGLEDLMVCMEGLDAVIVVDAVKASGRAGELRRFEKEAVLARGPALALSPHEPRLREALLASELHGAAPRELVLLGVIPGRVDGGIGLSAAVRRAVPGVVDAVVSELVRLGMPPAPRVPPLPPDVWWER